MKNFKININNIEIESKDIISNIRKCKSQDAIFYIIDKTGCNYDEAYQVVNEIKQTIHEQNVRGAGIKEKNKLSKSYSSASNIPHCPTCNSTNIKRISTASKAVGAGLFGLFSKTAKSQFECRDCGYKW